MSLFQKLNDQEPPITDTSNTYSITANQHTLELKMPHQYAARRGGMY